MHIDFDLKSPCPVAHIFLLLSDPGHATGHAEYPQVRAMTIQCGAQLLPPGHFDDRSRPGALYQADVKDLN